MRRESSRDAGLVPTGARSEPRVLGALGSGGARRPRQRLADDRIGAAIVLVVSFILLGALWRRPILEAHVGGRLLPHGLSALVLSRPLRRVLQAIAVGLLALTLATALFGTTVELLNFSPTFVYVIFWLGSINPLLL